MVQSAHIINCYQELLAFIEHFSDINIIERLTTNLVALLPDLFQALVENRSFSIRRTKLLFNRTATFTEVLLPEIEGLDKDSYNKFVDILLQVALALPNERSIQISAMEHGINLALRNSFSDLKQKQAFKTLARRFQKTSHNGETTNELSEKLLNALLPKGYIMSPVYNFLETINHGFRCDPGVVSNDL